MEAIEQENEEFTATPPEIREQATRATDNLLPEKSRIQYERAYNQFSKWCSEKQIKMYSENVLLAYFQQLSASMKPSSLWAIYSMLRSTLNLKNNVDISKYPKLCSFLKRTSDGYKPKKSKILTSQQIQKFITTAPDEKFLFTKVAMIFGVMGACRREELMKIETKDIEDLGTAFLVHIPDTKTKTERQFVIGGNFYKTCKKYMQLRPSNLPTNVTRFFLNYQRGKCTKQHIGINKFGNIAREIAQFLKLPDPTRYTGHCLRRSSATILVDSGADITALKRHGGWRSTTVAEGYIDHSLNNKIETANKILNSIENTENITETSKSPIRNTNNNSNFNIAESINISFDNNEAVSLDCNNSSENTVNLSSNQIKQFDGKNLGTSMVSFNNCSNFSNLTVNVYLPK